MKPDQLRPIAPFPPRFGTLLSSLGMSLRLSLGLSLGAGLLALPLLWPQPSPAIEFADGTTHFIGIPRIQRFASSQSSARAWNARYTLTLEIPANASASLGQLTLTHSQGASANLRYDLGRFRAYTGTNDRAPQLPLGPIAFDRDRQILQIPFDLPVPPGTIVTLEIYPVTTPDEGISLFGITASPAGKQPSPQFLGYGRLHFDSADWGSGFH